jgi:sporulation protein YlmC with PRC-barrel domain
MAKDEQYETEDGSRIAPLGELHDFEVAEGFPDIRGWRVDSADGARVGTVHELLVDIDSMRTRYLDVRLTSEIAAAPGDRDVLVPIGAARIDDEADVVLLPLTSERVSLLPPYDHGRLARAHEYEVRRHFSLGRSAAAGAAVTAESREFYDDEHYDDKRFFSARRSTERQARDKKERDRDVDLRRPAGANADIRIPVEKDESVVLKRGDGGRDEIIIRKPPADETRAP